MQRLRIPWYEQQPCGNAGQKGAAGQQEASCLFHYEMQRKAYRVHWHEIEFHGQARPMR